MPSEADLEATARSLIWHLEHTKMSEAARLGTMMQLAEVMSALDGEED